MHYVMADIHGQYNKYRQMIDKIKLSDSDKVYILGDVIDRGADGGLMLLEALTNPQVILLLGNHEYMMMNSVKNGGELKRWLRNGATPTIEQMEEYGINIYEISENIRESCPVIIPDLEINGQKYYLTHAFPLKKEYDRAMYIDDLTEHEVEDAVWSRLLAEEYAEKVAENNGYDDGTKIIIGHTPVSYTPYYKHDESGMPLISRTENGIITNIDCGCASGIRLGCLRLEDGAEFYV